MHRNLPAIARESGTANSFREERLAAKDEHQLRNRMMLIDHLGIVVQSLEEAIRQWELIFGYRKCSGIVINTRQKVRIVFLSKPNSLTIKLIEPSEPASPVSAFARRGGGVHHICFKCNSINATITDFKSQGARLITPPQPGEAFNNHDIAFLLVPGNLNVELIDTSEKYGWNQSDAAPAATTELATAHK
jgi:methylmalonyl-CoA/ethylmalonyl-CoA epimerase